MRVPVRARSAMEDLYETNSLFEQPPTQKALPAQRLRLLAGETVQPACRLGFAVQIRDLRHAELHSCRELIAAEASIQIAVSGMLVHMFAVHRRKPFHSSLSGCRVRFRRSREVGNRIARASEC